MNYDRRRVGLKAKIQLLSEALEKQKKTRDGKWRNGWVLLKRRPKNEDLRPKTPCVSFSPRGLRFSPWGLRFSPRGLRS